MNLRFAGALVLVAALCGCKKAPVEALNPLSNSNVKVTMTDSNPGKGDTAAVGDRVYVWYTGKLTTGTTFDSNIGKEPYALVLGQHSVIEGWEKGLIGMKEGGKRHLSIPPELGYAGKVQEKIPANSTLEFDVELVHITKPGNDDTYAKTDTKVGTGPEAKVGDTVTFHYSGAYVGGKIFDDSEKRPGGAKPVSVKLGNKELVPALDTGVLGMKPGGIRVIDAEPGVLFGQMGNGSMRGGTPVTYTVKMISVNGSK